MSSPVVEPKMEEQLQGTFDQIVMNIAVVVINVVVAVVVVVADKVVMTDYLTL